MDALQFSNQIWQSFAQFGDRDIPCSICDRAIHGKMLWFRVQTEHYGALWVAMLRHEASHVLSFKLPQCTYGLTQAFDHYQHLKYVIDKRADVFGVATVVGEIWAFLRPVPNIVVSTGYPDVGIRGICSWSGKVLWQLQLHEPPFSLVYAFDGAHMAFSSLHSICVLCLNRGVGYSLWHFVAAQCQADIVGPVEMDLSRDATFLALAVQCAVSGRRHRCNQMAILCVVNLQQKSFGSFRWKVETSERPVSLAISPNTKLIVVSCVIIFSCNASVFGNR